MSPSINPLDPQGPRGPLRPLKPARAMSPWAMLFLLVVVLLAIWYLLRLSH